MEINGKNVIIFYVDVYAPKGANKLNKKNTPIPTPIINIRNLNESRQKSSTVGFRNNIIYTKCKSY